VYTLHSTDMTENQYVTSNLTEILSVVCPVTPEEQIGPEGQKMYRSAVGSLLYLPD
jgi:hypothetical protein